MRCYRTLKTAILHTYEQPLPTSKTQVELEINLLL